MEVKKPDRRVARTRKLLRDALLSLVLEKGYEAVTIQDIIDRANVGRSTFYDHFLDKEQLFLIGFDELQATMAQQYSAATVSRDAHKLHFSLGMFEHVLSHQRLYRVLIGKQSGTIAVQRLKELITDLVCDELEALVPSSGTTPIQREIVIQYIVSSFMGLVIWRVDHESSYTAMQMDAMFQQLTLPGVLAGFGKISGW